MKTRIPSDREHEFALILSGIRELTTDIENALFEAGCDDATLSLRSGQAYLTFSRTAPSLKEAILSAIQNVRAAGIGADIIRVDNCDLVTQADIARRSARTRQSVHQYVTGTRGPGAFPPPVCDIGDGSPLWPWCEVAHWLWQNDLIKQDVLQDALDAAVINSVLDLHHLRQLNPKLTREVEKVVGQVKRR